MAKCTICNSEDADKTYRFAIVDQRSTSETQNYVVAKKTTTTTTERFVGVCRESFCSNCLKKQKLKDAGMAVLFSYLGIFLVMLVIGLKTDALSAGYFIGVFIFATVIAIIALVCVMTTKDPFLARTLMHEKSKKLLKYVPVDQSLYLSNKGKELALDTFKSKSGLRTSVADAIFDKFIKPGNGNDIVDSIVDRPERSEDVQS